MNSVLLSILVIPTRATVCQVKPSIFDIVSMSMRRLVRPGPIRVRDNIKSALAKRPAT